MSVGKFLTGTTLVAPAIGGGGYITYKELTKEESTVTSESSTNPTGVVSDGTSSTPLEGGSSSTAAPGVGTPAAEADQSSSGPSGGGTAQGQTPIVTSGSGGSGSHA